MRLLGTARRREHGHWETSASVRHEPFSIQVRLKGRLLSFSQALLDRRYNLVCTSYHPKTLYDQSLGVHQVIRRQGIHLVGLSHVRAPAVVRAHMDTFDLVFINRLSPSGLIRV